jgi:tetratricopeptide (TPR) repeat protein
LISPLLILVVLEVALRLADYGYPTTFFLRQRIGDQTFYVPNDRFGHRFFPATIARTPFAMRMPEKKSANTYRIFVFGESAAQGDPDPTFGVSRYLHTLLRQRYPGHDFEVVCVAMTAINSHAILPIARECAVLDGDLWIIYMGNNEMVGPYGAATIFGPKAPPLMLVRASIALKSTRLGQLIASVVGRFRKDPAAQKSWSGLNMFKENLLASNDSGRLRAYRNFAGNVESILHAGRQTGIPVLLSTVACNLADCSPFGSLHRADLSDDQKTAWSQHFDAGVQSQKIGDFPAARAAFATASDIDPQYAEIQYRMGQCDFRSTNFVSARHEFELARDYDAMVFRADAQINSIIARAAQSHERDRVLFVNAAEALATNSTGAVTGEDLFYEHVHLDFEGNYRLAKLFATEIARHLPAAFTENKAKDWASADECDRALAVSPWDRHRLWQANFSRVSEPPFTSQLDDAARAKRYMARLEQLRGQMTVEAQAQTRKLYQDALRTAPDDIDLHGNFAQVLADFSDFGGAVKEQRRVCELLPQSAAAFHRTGLLLIRQNEMGLAAAELKHALSLRPDYVPALNELGIIFANQQKTLEAEQVFQRSISLNPGYVESFINLGFMKQSTGKMSEALAAYASAAELQPEGPAAYFSKGAALANQGQAADAAKLFQAAGWMNPSFWQARYLLGVELVQLGRADEAEVQFAEVVRLRPDLAKAHLNLGVALAKRGKLDEALVQFETAMKLNPANESAKQNIEKTRTLLGRIRPGETQETIQK